MRIRRAAGLCYIGNAKAEPYSSRHHDARDGWLGGVEATQGRSGDFFHSDNLANGTSRG